MRLEYSDIINSLHLVAIKKVALSLKKQGYSVKEEYRIDQFWVDLFAEKGGEKEIYEFKIGNKAISKEQYEKLQTLARKNSAKLKIVYVFPPQLQTIIQFDLLPEIIFNDLFFSIPSELDCLSTHTRPESIKNLIIDKVIIEKEQINVSGSAEVEVSLQFGSDGDYNRGDGIVDYSSYGFTFALSLNNRMELVERYYNWEI